MRQTRGAVERDKTWLFEAIRSQNARRRQGGAKRGPGTEDGGRKQQVFVVRHTASDAAGNPYRHPCTDLITRTTLLSDQLVLGVTVDTISMTWGSVTAQRRT
jgi:hypothetical protein